MILTSRTVEVNLNPNTCISKTLNHPVNRSLLNMVDRIQVLL